jgi:cytoskeleton protein RodZ
MNEPLARPGARLKAERERRHLSLEKAGNALHLDAWVVAALEADDYPGIGPAVYVKGHLRRYAELLGLPESEIIAGYHSGAAVREAPAAQPPTVRVPTGPAPVNPLPWPQVAAMAAAAVLLLGVLWWKPWQHRGATATVATQPPASRPGAAPVPAPASPPTAALPAPAGSAATPPEAEAAHGAGRARLRMSFSADSWVDVHDAEGRRAYAGNGRANSVKTITGEAPMRVYLGFASGVQLEINDRAVAIGRQFMAGNVARFEAGADGVLRRDSHAVASHSAQNRIVRPTG